jgi:hypothetical protein
MTKYDPRTRYYPAFDDGELFIDLHEEFTDSEKAKSFVRARNGKEFERLGGQEPDTRWFVAKVVQRLTVEWTDKASHQPPKKRVVRKKATP